MIKNKFRLSLLLGATALFAAAPAYGAITFEVRDLGVLPGGVSSIATSVDDSGEVVGYTTFGDGSTEGFYWTQAGGMVGLGGTDSRALGVNNGNVVGVTGVNGQAFRWTQSTGTVLLDSANRGQANGVNASGEAVGNRMVATNNHVLTWSSANTISNPFPALNLTGIAINDLGHFVGVNVGAGYYNDGVSSSRTALVVLPTSISNNDIVAGAQSQIAAFENVNTLSTTNIGTLPGGLTSNALGINPLGTEIVGLSSGSNGPSAFLYDIATSDLQSVNSLLDPSFSGWSITTGNAINDSGQIAATGLIDGVQHAVLLQAVPEPSTFAAGCLGFISLLIFAIRKTASKRLVPLTNIGMPTSPSSISTE